MNQVKKYLMNIKSTVHPSPLPRIPTNKISKLSCASPNKKRATLKIVSPIENKKSNLTPPLFLTTREFQLDLKRGIIVPKRRDDYKMKIGENNQVSWRNLDGEWINTGYFRFIVEANHDIYAVEMEPEAIAPTLKRQQETPVKAMQPQAPSPRFHHGSLVGEGWPIFAGRAEALNGEIYLLNNHSGHFVPPKNSIDIALQLFKEKGANVSKAEELWHKGCLYDINNPNNPSRYIGSPLKDKIFPIFFGIHDKNHQLNTVSFSPKVYREQVKIQTSER